VHASVSGQIWAFVSVCVSNCHLMIYEHVEQLRPYGATSPPIRLTACSESFTNFMPVLDPTLYSSIHVSKTRVLRYPSPCTPSSKVYPPPLPSQFVSSACRQLISYSPSARCSTSLPSTSRSGDFTSFVWIDHGLRRVASGCL